MPRSTRRVVRVARRRPVAASSSLKPQPIPRWPRLIELVVHVVPVLVGDDVDQVGMGGRDPDPAAQRAGGVLGRVARERLGGAADLGYLVRCDHLDRNVLDLVVVMERGEYARVGVQVEAGDVGHEREHVPVFVAEPLDLRCSSLPRARWDGASCPRPRPCPAIRPARAARAEWGRRPTRSPAAAQARQARVGREGTASPGPFGQTRRCGGIGYASTSPGARLDGGPC